MLLRGTFKHTTGNHHHLDHYYCSTRIQQLGVMSCSFCQRPVPTREHHIVPRCKGGKQTVPACVSCEDFIHKTWTHNQLRDTYNTVASILADAGFQRFLKWLYKQPITVVQRSARNSNRSAHRYR